MFCHILVVCTFNSYMHAILAVNYIMQLVSYNIFMYNIFIVLWNKWRRWRMIKDTFSIVPNLNIVKLAHLSCAIVSDSLMNQTTFLRVMLTD